LVALLKKPHILILDEISSGLDIISRKQIISLIRKYSKENEITLVVISHNPHEIKQLTDNAILLARGKVVGDKIDISNYTEAHIKRVLTMPTGELVRLQEDLKKAQKKIKKLRNELEKGKNKGGSK
jgi:ABC-type multidrug transport system ATPase subunit